MAAQGCVGLRASHARPAPRTFTGIAELAGRDMSQWPLEVTMGNSRRRPGTDPAGLTRESHPRRTVSDHAC